jgi:glycosyltransferase involved in cell wall biosynthesis
MLGGKPSRNVGEAGLRIAVHDYGCYPFTFELSRELAGRGHQVQHFYFAQNTTPQAVASCGGSLDPAARGIRINGEFDKWSLMRRRFQEMDYGDAAAQAIGEFSPDIIVSANTPIDAQWKISALCRSRGIPMVLWQQDVISVAMRRILSKRIPVFGDLVGRYYGWREAAILRRSAAVITIAPHFLDICEKMGACRKSCHVVENWAPLSEIFPCPRRNGWSNERGLSDKLVILYSGTLGFKHNPVIFERLALHFLSQTDVRIVVVSEGPGAAWLKDRKTALQLDNLLLLPFQPYGRLSEVLSSGDVLLAILDEDAGVFSVPSKVLTYLAVGRPLLLSVPEANLAAETVRRADAGRIIAPADIQGLTTAAAALLSDADLCAVLGRNARAYAERNFDIGTIADRFEQILRDAATQDGSR